MPDFKKTISDMSRIGSVVRLEDMLGLYSDLFADVRTVNGVRTAGDMPVEDEDRFLMNLLWLADQIVLTACETHGDIIKAHEMQEDVDDVRQEIETLKVRLQAIRPGNDALAERRRQLANLKTELGDEQRREELLRADCKRLQEEIDWMQGVELSGVQAKKLDLEKQKRILQDEIREQRERNQDAANNNRDLEQQLAEQRKKLEILNGTIGSQTNDKISLRKEIEENQSRTQELSKEILELMSLRDDRKEQLSKAQKQQEDLSREATTLAEQQIPEAENSLEQIRAEIRERLERCKVLQEEAVREQEREKQILAEIEKRNTELAVLGDANDSKEKKLEEINRRCDELGEENEVLETQIAKASGQCAEVQRQVDSRRADLETADFDALLQKRKQELTELEQEYQDKSATLSDLGQKLRDKEREILEAEEQIRQKETELTGKILGYTEQNERQRERVQGLEVNITELRAVQKQLEDQIRETEERLRNEQSQRDKKEKDLELQKLSYENWLAGTATRDQEQRIHNLENQIAEMQRLTEVLKAEAAHLRRGGVSGDWATVRLDEIKSDLMQYKARYQEIIGSLGK